MPRTPPASTPRLDLARPDLWLGRHELLLILFIAHRVIPPDGHTRRRPRCRAEEIRIDRQRLWLLLVGMQCASRFQQAPRPLAHPKSRQAKVITPKRPVRVRPLGPF
jgi:hypothetical protein